MLLLTDDGGNRDYNAPSIVYKLSLEEYFVPFQALRVNGVTSWLPVRYNKVGFGHNKLFISCRKLNKFGRMYLNQFTPKLHISRESLSSYHYLETSNRTVSTLLTSYYKVGT